MPSLLDRLRTIVGPEWVRTDEATRARSTARTPSNNPGLPDVVVLPRDTREIARWRRSVTRRGRRSCRAAPGTGYSGGAVPLRGGVLLSLERLNRILEIDERSLFAVVQPGVITGVLQAEVEARGLFYPPDPASLDRSAIGGNVAECAGGPRAFS